MLLGFELPNVPNPGPETWEQVDAIRSTVVKVRPYHLLPSTLSEIQRRGLSVLLRHDADGEIDVPARVRELSGAAWTLREHGIGDITIILDNEPNHTGGGPDKPCPPDYWQKVSQVVTGLYYGHFDTRPLAGTVRYGSPPMAVAQGEAAWYEAGKDIIPAFDVVCVHLYGQTDNSLITYALQLVSVFNKPLIADELGNTDHHLSPDNKAFMVASFARQAAEAGVEAATIFIAQTPTPDWNHCTLPTDKLGMIADAVATVQPSVPPPGTTVQLSLANHVLSRWPGPVTTPEKPLVWDQWEGLVRRAAQLQPHLQPDELAQVALGPLATLDQESDGKIRADGDRRKSDGYYCSRGLFQLNTCGGAGTTMMRDHGITNPDDLYGLKWQYLHAEKLLLATEEALYWARKQGVPYWPGRALQGIQRSSSDPNGHGYQAAYARLANELGLEVQPMGTTMRIGNLDVPDLRGRYPSTYTRRELSEVTNIGIHHSATPTLPDDASEADELAALDAIHAYHLAEFRGIAYPMVVFPSGRCYLTGDWDTVRYLVGGQGNVHTLGVLLHGTFMGTVPGAKQIEAARKLIANVRYQLGNGDLPVVGHKDIGSKPTACPGDTWDIWRPWLTEEAEPTAPVDTRSALHIQLDSLWGIADRLGEHPEAQAIRNAVSAAKDAAGIA